LINFADLFTPRQLTALTTVSDLVGETRQQIEADARAAGLSHDLTPLRDGGSGVKAYAEAVSTYLGMAVSRLSDIQNTLCRWEISKTQVRNLFSRQGIPMMWDYAENNLFNKAAGDFSVTLETMVRVLERSVVGSNLCGVAVQKDATNLGKSKQINISTDPPYYDNIGYADLSDFFYVWLRPNLREVYPDIFSTMLVPKAPELIASPYRSDGDKQAAEQHFETGLNQAFAQIRQIIPPDYPLTVYYAFKQQEIVVEEGTASTGWETMLTGLIETGFQIVGTWPIRTELSNRPVASGTNALASSIVLVCRPRPDNAPITSRREFVNALRRELPPALQEMQSGNIAPVDLAQASIGPGMAVYSRYSQVLEPNGERLTVRTALQLINHELDAYLAEQEGDIDADSRFAVAWFEQFGFKEGGFGQADVLARAKNTSVDGLRNAGVLKAGAGKVQLLRWSELEPGWDPATDRRVTVWEATHHLIERLNTYGEEGAARLLARMSPELAAAARQLAYRLYSMCERKGWAEQARDYNALVISWSASQEQARDFREQYQQGRLFE
jgi:putative DNA methylase